MTASRHIITTEIERLVMALESPTLATTPEGRVAQRDDQRLSSGERAVLQIAHMIATNAIDDTRMRDLRARVDARLNLLIDDALPRMDADYDSHGVDAPTSEQSELVDDFRERFYGRLAKILIGVETLDSAP